MNYSDRQHTVNRICVYLVATLCNLRIYISRLQNDTYTQIQHKIRGKYGLEAVRKVVGWVERSEPHRKKRLESGGARYARPTLQLCFQGFSDSL